MLVLTDNAAVENSTKREKYGGDQMARRSRRKRRTGVGKE